MTPVSTEALPAGWARATIDDLVNPEVEQGRPTGDGDFLYIDITSIDKKAKRITTPKTLAVGEAPSRARQHVRPGDVLVSMTRPNLNAVAHVPEGMGNAVASTGFCVLRSMGPDSRLLYYLVQTAPFVEEMSRRVTGALYPAVRPGDIHSYTVPVPSLPEQHRIVGEIEKQFTRLDAAVAALEHSRANFELYRASVLKAACEGRLVPTEADLARAEGRDFESAEVLLERILRERRARWEVDQLAKMEASGKSPKDGAWKAKYKVPEPPDTEGLPELPEGWAWATVHQLAADEPNSLTDGPFGSNLKTSHYTPDGPRVIRLQNVGDAAFIDAEAHISQDHYERLAKHRVAAGDLVIAALGENPPRACLIPPFVGPAIVKADCIRFKPDRTLATASYLNLALNAAPTRKRVEAMVHGVGRPRLNLSEIRSIALPLPINSEQARIGDEAERRLSVIDELDGTIERALSRAERLRQSILKSAFEGRLVPQDSNDEPASQLLERIRADRSRARKKKRPRGSTKVRADRGIPGETDRRPLAEVLESAPDGMSANQLLEESGHTMDTIDEFYVELKMELDKGRVQEVRRSGSAVILKRDGK